ncbi:phosphate propanoyltransferase [Lysinibacillus sp. BW-2-10]|uniref:phosphate propanoyltransferase n=1 Tax=Lysinibacillus sp. BW-2-10 TaxID=2590030 RepID=UPI0011801B8D|nr:phosphate propanoyltransferase [Lysinibacillus sp. BW-2-10]TSI07878.1 phosphate propanoyltransferase [Lysinibacillus sp. BW-2-10]
MDEQLIQAIVEQVLTQLNQTATPTEAPDQKIPIAISARHVHLSLEHIEHLFGEGYTLTPKSELSQPGQFAAMEQVTIVGPKDAISNVRVLGPARDLTQVEVSLTDARKLGIPAPLRFSGDIQNSAPVTIVGPKGSIYLHEGCIVAASHIHMSPEDARRFNVTDGQSINVRAYSARPVIFTNVKIRVSERYQLEMHIDTDEGNAAFIQGSAYGEIISEEETNQPIPTIKKEASTPEQKKELIVYQKKVLTEQAVLKLTTPELLLPKKTIVTALAEDAARRKGITLVRQ